MEKLAEKYDGTIQVVKVDVDANPILSQAFNIMSIPTIAFFRPGKDENGNSYTPQGVVGFRPLDQLEAQFGLKQFTPAPAPAEQASETAA
jgi:thioredoxin 1